MIFKLHIEKTLKKLLEQEDTDGDKKITINDSGPKRFNIINDNKKYTIQGTYHLSNLLQELILSKNNGNDFAYVDLSRIEELPCDRISRMIKEYYWDGLTRTMDKSGIDFLLLDAKNEKFESDFLRVYVPYNDLFSFNYYKKLEKGSRIEVVRLPKNITPSYVKSINSKPGILSLKLEEKEGKVKGVPFVVPGGRFNEMYGWDSYFESVGLLLDGRVDLAQAMADNFQYQIIHYGKILNANRSYYLTRTQPPFYTSLVREVYEFNKDKKWLKSHLKTAITEYLTVWSIKGSRLVNNGLNRYLAEGIGIPPECEKGHFDAVIKPLADNFRLTIEDFVDKYDKGVINNEYLDSYFIHDRSARESGHDTSYRLDGNCANLNLVELNSMLYKYEIDIAEIIQFEFDDVFQCDEQVFESKYWFDLAKRRKIYVNKYLWNQEKGMFFDYDFKNKKQSSFVSATTFSPLWCKMISDEQAKILIENAVNQLKEKGGILASTFESRGNVSESRPQRQWDYPFGWAPHQMMIWKGLYNYGYYVIAQELIYRWLYMITKNAVEYNGTIPEKYDVVKCTHLVFAEYGNVGTDFEYITKEGFGWMNASFQYGLSLLNKKYVEMLNELKPPDDVVFD